MSNILLAKRKKILFVLGLFFLFLTTSFIFLEEVAYIWIKALHTIAVIAWMAGMLYLPRIFVYHAEVQTGSDTSETFKVMEHKLLHIIMNPAMAATWVLGSWMAWQQDWYNSGWFIAKLVLVLLMTIAHCYLYISVCTFADDKNKKTNYYWRVFNEVPTVLVIGIIILVIVKPF
ncbi:MAG: protoporphyrinogen oxidase HemJ [Hyphomicrobiaceae bacterium]|nr:protoporphyrinogen oxidase HemJ [Hyphomicrobiaceae bacterium]